VDDALALLANAHDLYQKALPSLRRQLNQAVFTKFRVHEGGNVRAELAAGFRALVEGCGSVEGAAEPKAADDSRVETDEGVEQTKRVARSATS
jgi:hypothetical protein